MQSVVLSIFVSAIPRLSLALCFDIGSAIVCVGNAREAVIVMMGAGGGDDGFPAISIFHTTFLPAIRITFLPAILQ